MKSLARVVFAGSLALSLVIGLGCSQSESTPEVGLITPDQLLSEPPADALILDVRTPEEYAQGHVPGAVNVPHTEVAARLDEIEAEVGGDPSRPVVVYCERGARAAKAEAELLEAGYRQVLHLEGDMSDWRAKGRATERS